MNLLSSSMAKSSWNTYQRALTLLEQFLIQFSFTMVFPLQPPVVALFVSYMHGKKYASSTIITYLSAISYVHKLQGVSDPTNSWLVEKVVQGAKKVKPQCDVRLPITKQILEKLVNAAEICVQGFYRRSMFVSMVLLAFSAFLRVGEMAMSNGNTNNVLKLRDLEFVSAKSGTATKITFTNFKHSAGRTARVEFDDPVTSSAVKKYLANRGNKPGYLFMWPSGKPITRLEFDDMFKACLKFCHLDSSAYKSHSLRIGAASHAAAVGFTAIQIREMGRWHSDAFMKYIRFQ